MCIFYEFFVNIFLVLDLSMVVDIFNPLLAPRYLCFNTWFSITYYLVHARSDTESLQSLTEKQAQQITENTLYTKELEVRERALIQNVIPILSRN